MLQYTIVTKKKKELKCHRKTDCDELVTLLERGMLCSHGPLWDGLLGIGSCCGCRSYLWIRSQCVYGSWMQHAATAWGGEQRLHAGVSWWPTILHS